VRQQKVDYPGASGEGGRGRSRAALLTDGGDTFCAALESIYGNDQSNVIHYFCLHHFLQHFDRKMPNALISFVWTIWLTIIENNICYYLLFESSRKKDGTSGFEPRKAILKQADYDTETLPKPKFYCGEVEITTALRSPFCHQIWQIDRTSKHRT